MNFSSKQAPVFYSENAYEQINNFIGNSSYSTLFILVDTNTHNLCLASFLEKLQTDKTLEIIEMEAGEENKNIETCTGIWNVLSELGADRKSLMINLGGGVVTDLGGFIAATFKRGIAYINVPTTLLSMVDASVGGKTGVDLGNLKNQIGVITQPEMVLIDTSYLDSLPANEMRSGLAEILKHGLIADRKYWDKATNLQDLTLDDLEHLIAESIEIKTRIVEKDPKEENLRKTLNFGHTLGHGIESYFLSNSEKETLLHGEAIAVGMIMALYASHRITDFPKNELREVSEKIIGIFPKVKISESEFEEIIELLKFDKKNSHGKVNFVLLKNFGDPVIDCSVPREILFDALKFYSKL